MTVMVWTIDNHFVVANASKGWEEARTLAMPGDCRGLQSGELVGHYAQYPAFCGIDKHHQRRRSLRLTSWAEGTGGIDVWQGATLHRGKLVRTLRTCRRHNHPFACGDILSYFGLLVGGRIKRLLHSHRLLLV
jgi:hypothetical protein